ncbi:MAG: LolA family protein [Gemmatimonadales bacterium]
MRRPLAAALIALVMPAPATPQAPADAVAIVRRASAAYRGLGSLQADFVQIIEDATLGDTLRSTGRLAQAGDNRFAMRFTDPPEDAIVIDGRHVWIYTPSTTPGQVLRAPVESDPVYGANLLARILDRPADRYRVAYVKADEVGGRSLDVVSIVPQSGTMRFNRAVLWLDRDDALPRRIELDESPGVRRILILSRLRPNATLPPRAFTFDVPRGVRVIDQ